MRDKENFDDLSMFCGPKEFYDINCDGHLDAFEAGMMICDAAEEAEEVERLERTQSGRDFSSIPPKSKGGGGVLRAIKLVFIFLPFYMLLLKILDKIY